MCCTWLGTQCLRIATAKEENMLTSVCRYITILYNIILCIKLTVRLLL